MSSTNTPTSSSSNVKKELIRPPSPAPSTCTTVLRTSSYRPPSPTPSTSSSVNVRGKISIRPLSSIIDPDDFLVSSANQETTSCPKFDSRRTALPIEGSNDWRSSRKRVTDRLKYILTHDNFYQDVVFDVQNEKIKAHQLILRIASPMFDRIFTDADCFTKISSSQEKAIEIRDMEPSTFKHMLKFIYTDEVSRRSLNDQELLSLLKASKMYGVQQLYNTCKKMFMKSLSNSIAVPLCEVAASFEDQDLLESTFSHIADHASAIFDSEEFLLLSDQTLAKLLDRDDLNIDELSVFVNVLRWAQSKCREKEIPMASGNLRLIAKEIIPKIRFPLMKRDQFALQVTATNLLTPEENNQIYQYLCVEPSKLSELPPMKFITTPRRSKKCLELALVNPVRSVESTPYATTECIEIPTASENESETCSEVSQNSELKKKKLKRAHSSPISSSKQTKKRRKSNSQYCQEQMKELFGEFTSISQQFVLTNKNINLNQVIKKLKSFNNLNEIKSIIFDNVTISDFKELISEKVKLPNLEVFQLNIKVSESTKSILVNDDFELEKLLFFCKRKPPSEWLYKDLYRSNVKINVTINNVVVLDMCLMVGHVVLNKFNGCGDILKSLRDENDIESIVYSHPNLMEKYFPPRLKRLVILSSVIKKSVSLCEFLQGFTDLLELTIFPAAASVDDTSPWTIDKRFKSKEKLKICGLRGINLSISSSVKLEQMTALYLWGSKWDKSFEDRFHHIFPNLQEVLICGTKSGSSGSPRLLKNILKISTLKQVFSWAIDWQITDEDANHIRKHYNAPVIAKEKSFHLDKRDYNWHQSKVRLEDLERCAYEKFHYDFLYKDFSTYNSAS